MVAKPKKPVIAPRRRAPAPAPPVHDDVADRFIRGDAATGHASADVPPKAPAKRAPAGSKLLIAREGGRQRARKTIYFDPDVAAALKSHCATEGVEESHLVNLAVFEYLRRRRARG
jgi:hypothetical protein